MPFFFQDFCSDLEGAHLPVFETLEEYQAVRAPGILEYP